MLVSRLADRRALARLVRAALRHEVAQVVLAAGPQRAEAHTLDLHVAGEAPLALLAEPAGAPQNGHFPLRLRPLYRAQAAQLYALLDRETVSVDGPTAPDTVPLGSGNAAPMMQALTAAAPPLSEGVITERGMPPLGRQTAPMLRRPPGMGLAPPPPSIHRCRRPVTPAIRGGP